MEKDSIQKLLLQADDYGRAGDENREDKRMASDDFAQNGSKAGWGQDEALDGSMKQVRFSPSMPPSRQSRYGPDDDEYTSIGGSDQSLLTGSTSSFRRRQVSRLMSLQETPREMESVGSQRNDSVSNLESVVEALVEAVAVGDVLLRWVWQYKVGVSSSGGCGNTSGVCGGCGCGGNILGCGYPPSGCDLHGGCGYILLKWVWSWRVWLLLKWFYTHTAHQQNWSFMDSTTVIYFALLPSRTPRTSQLLTR